MAAELNDQKGKWTFKIKNCLQNPDEAHFKAKSKDTYSFLIQLK